MLATGQNAGTYFPRIWEAGQKINRKSYQQGMNLEDYENDRIIEIVHC